MTKAKWMLAMVAAAASAISCGQSGPESPDRAAAKVAAPSVTPAPDGETGAAFREPKQVRRSANGELNTTLDLRFAKNKLAGRNVETATFDGDIPGPTFRIRPGDRLKIKYTNSLKYPLSILPEAEAAKAQKMAEMMVKSGMHMEGPPTQEQLNGGFLLSNIHTHGLQVSPTGNADNPFLIFKPGDTFDYEIHVPKDQPAGLHWYHPHRHSSSAKQGWSGLGGAIIVEGEIDKVPQVAAAHERLMLLQEIWLDNKGHVPMGLPIPTAGDVPFSTIPAVPSDMYYTINGVHQPVLNVHPGSIERWRIANESPHKFSRLTLDGHTFYQIAQDGIAFSEPKPRTEILMAPGNRAEVLIKVAGSGTYKLKALAYDQGHPGGAMPEELMLTMVGSEAPESGSLPTELVPAYPAISKEPVVKQREVVFSGVTDVAPVQFFLNKKKFDGDRSDANVKVGTVEEWTLVNDDVYQHPFHIHVNPFQVLEVGGKRYTDDDVWWDTFALPRKSRVKVRMKFRPDVTGKTVYHCHILPHEDNGMMSAFVLMPAEGGPK
jgi:FtsP/CotA-like multicopper oxidase with cupredoxin domain